MVWHGFPQRPETKEALDWAAVVTGPYSEVQTILAASRDEDKVDLEFRHGDTTIRAKS